jgi:hypothetical protein
VLCLQLTLWLLARHINNKELNWIIIKLCIHLHAYWTAEYQILKYEENKEIWQKHAHKQKKRQGNLYQLSKKGKVVPWCMREWMHRSTFFLTSALVGGEWSASRPGRFTPWERAPGTHRIGSWMGPRVALDDMEKRKFLILLWLELRPLVRPARSQSLCRQRYLSYLYQLDSN